MPYYGTKSSTFNIATVYFTSIQRNAVISSPLTKNNILPKQGLKGADEETFPFTISLGLTSMYQDFYQFLPAGRSNQIRFNGICPSSTDPFQEKASIKKEFYTVNNKSLTSHFLR